MCRSRFPDRLLQHYVWLTKWQRDFPWLDTRVVDGKWGIGCLACAHVGATGSSMAKFQCSRFPLIRSLFDQHEGTPQHQEAIKGLRHLRPDAPPASHFAAVLAAVRTNTQKVPIENVCGLHKLAKNAVVLGRSFSYIGPPLHQKGWQLHDLPR